MKSLIPSQISKSIDKIYQTILPNSHYISKIDNENKMLKMRLDDRVYLDSILYYSDSEPSIKIPRTPISYDDIEYMFDNNSTIKRCVIAIREEVFRNGYKITEKFKFKCTKCGQEYDQKPDDGICNNQHAKYNNQSIECQGLLKEPDAKQKENAKNFFKAVNENRQTIKQLYKEIETDINKYDEGWILARQTYEIDDYGNIQSCQIKELVRAAPKHIKWITDDKGRIGRKYAICLKHREEVQDYAQEYCKICNRKLHNVVAVGVDKGSQHSPQTYYIDKEIIHVSYYSPSLLYGYSPIATLWETGISLIKMIDYIYSNYDKKRMPSGAVTIKTNNLESAKAHWKGELEMIKKDRNHIPLICVDPTSTGNGFDFVKFQDTIKEMEYKEIRDEFKKEIGALYGVEPFFMNDTSTSGGLNNEGLQITVTNRTTESHQQYYNDIINPAIMDLLGVTDYEFIINPPEEKDEAHDLDLEFKKIQNAQAMAMLGYDVELDDDGEFKYTKINQSSMQDYKPQGDIDYLNNNNIYGNLNHHKPFKDNSEDLDFASSPDIISRSEIKKNRVYITNPDKAPSGIQPHQGPKGGWYYETTIKPTSGGQSKPPKDYKTNGVKIITTQEGTVYAGQSGDKHHYKIMDRHGLPSSGKEYDKMLRTAYEPQKNRVKIDTTAEHVDKYGKQFMVQIKWYVQQGVPDVPVKDAWGDYLGMLYDIAEHGTRAIAKSADRLSKSIWDEALELVDKGQLWDDYKSLSAAQSSLVNKILKISFTKGYREYNVKDIIKQIMSKTNLTKYEAERIFRTEEQNIVNKARVIYYKKEDPENEYKYKWLGPLDNRTTSICKNIQARTVKGVSLNQLKRIIKEEAKKENIIIKSNRPYTPHINCRHKFVRLV